MVDDGSGEEAKQLQAWYASHDSRFREISPPPGASGANACRQAGVEACRSPWVVFLDSDDMLVSTALERRLSLCVGSEMVQVVNAEGFDYTPGDKKVLFNVATAENPLDRFLKLDVPWQTTAPTWPRETLAGVGGFDLSLPSWQDWELHVRALIKGVKFQFHSQSDYYYRLKEPGKTTNKQMTDRHHLEHGVRLMTKVERLLADHHQLTALRSHFLELIQRHLLMSTLHHHGLASAISLLHTRSSCDKAPVIFRLLSDQMLRFAPRSIRHHALQVVWGDAFRLHHVNRLCVRLSVPEWLASTK